MYQQNRDSILIHCIFFLDCNLACIRYYGYWYDQALHYFMIPKCIDSICQESFVNRFCIMSHSCKHVRCLANNSTINVVERLYEHVHALIINCNEIRKVWTIFRTFLLQLKSPPHCTNPRWMNWKTYDNTYNAVMYCSICVIVEWTTEIYSHTSTSTITCMKVEPTGINVKPSESYLASHV